MLAPGKRHEKVGRTEATIKRIKKVIVSILGTFCFSDVWDFSHQVSLISYYLNERPIFFSNFEILTPNTLESAMLKRSPQAPKVYTLSEFTIPSHKKTIDSIFEMKEISKQVLSHLAAAMAMILLNQKSQTTQFKMGQLVYLPDRLLRKNPNSIQEALAYIINIEPGGRNYVVKTLDGRILSRHLTVLVDAKANRLEQSVQVIDLFQLPNWQEAILPDDLIVKFDLFLDKFRDHMLSLEQKEPRYP